PAPPPHLRSLPTRRSSDLWQVLAALPFVPPGPDRPNSPDRNKAIAQAIVRFRDGDLLHGMLPHGPFQNIFELNLVPGFRDALGRSEEHTSELQSRGQLVCR